MSATPSSPPPALPPGKPREELLRYFAEVWPAGQRIASVKPTEWSPEGDREDDDDDEEEGGSTATESRPVCQTPCYGGAHLAKVTGWDVNDYHHDENIALFRTQAGALTSVEWYYMHTTQWKRDPRSDEPGWLVTQVTGLKVIVMRVNA